MKLSDTQKYVTSIYYNLHAWILIINFLKIVIRMKQTFSEIPWNLLKVELF
jgi:hypothetical protein